MMISHRWLNLHWGKKTTRLPLAPYLELSIGVSNMINENETSLSFLHDIK